MNEMVHEEAKHDNELAVEGKKAFMQCVASMRKFVKNSLQF